MAYNLIFKNQAFRKRLKRQKSGLRLFIVILPQPKVVNVTGFPVRAHSCLNIQRSYKQLQLIFAESEFY